MGINGILTLFFLFRKASKSRQDIDLLPPLPPDDVLALQGDNKIKPGPDLQFGDNDFWNQLLADKQRLTIKKETDDIDKVQKKQATAETEIEEFLKSPGTEFQHKKPGLLERWREAKEEKRVKSEINKAIEKAREPEIIQEKEQPIQPFHEEAGSTENKKQDLPTPQEIKKKIADARSSLINFKLDEAKRTYIDIIKAYNIISQEGKEEVYHEILELYDDRKNAEGLLGK